MKYIPFLLINLATVAIGIAIYDHYRDSDQDTPTTNAHVNESDLRGVEKRLAALEAEQTPMLHAPDSLPGIKKRLLALESKLHQAKNEPSVATSESNSTAASSPSGQPFASRFEPTAEDVRRFRQLQEAVKRDERVQRHRARVNKTLDKLGLNLSIKQREDVAQKLADFGKRSNEIWDEVKSQARETMESGGTIDKMELMNTTYATLRTEFAVSLEGIVPVADAESIAAALMPHRRGK